MNEANKKANVAKSQVCVCVCIFLIIILRTTLVIMCNHYLPLLITSPKATKKGLKGVSKQQNPKVTIEISRGIYASNILGVNTLLLLLHSFTSSAACVV